VAKAFLRKPLKGERYDPRHPNLSLDLTSMEKACDSKGSPNFSNPLPDERGFPQTSDALPERWVTLHSGDMGDTFSRRREKVFMSWKECQIVEERLRFIARLLDGEKMAGLCREFGISRKTGYKIYHRYQNLRDRWANRPQSASLSSRQSASDAD
jgi:hypothetical protein